MRTEVTRIRCWLPFADDIDPLALVPVAEPVVPEPEVVPLVVPVVPVPEDDPPYDEEPEFSSVPVTSISCPE